MEKVRKGETWVDPEVADRTRQVKERASQAPSLTPRERELIDLVRQGLRNRDIATRLGVTEGTVKVYLHAIFDKIGVDNRTELAMRAADLLASYI
jgi:two-component system nitrate/nitrite response regulator NarP